MVMLVSVFHIHVYNSTTNKNVTSLPEIFPLDVDMVVTIFQAMVELLLLHKLTIKLQQLQ